MVVIPKDRMNNADVAFMMRIYQIQAVWDAVLDLAEWIWIQLTRLVDERADIWKEQGYYLGLSAKAHRGWKLPIQTLCRQMFL